VLPFREGEREAETVLLAGVGVGIGHVLAGLIGGHGADHLAAVVDVHHERRARRVVVDRPAPPDEAGRRHL